MRRARFALFLVLLIGSSAAGSDAADPNAPTLPLTVPTLAVTRDPPLPGEPTVGWPGLAEAPSAGPVLTLEEAIALAVDRHPLVLAARTGVRAATAERAAAGRIGNPSFEADMLPGDVELSARLDLTDGVLARLRVGVAGARLDAERSQAEAVRVRVEADVRMAYVALQAADLRLAVSQRALEIQAVGEDAALALLEAGSLPWADVVPHLAAYERLRATVVGLEVDVAGARERLAAAIGLVGVRIDVAPLPDLPREAGVPADLEARAVAASFDLAALRADVEALGRTATLARVAGALPEIEVGLLAAHERVGADLGGASEPWRLGGSVELSVPLFSQGVAAGRALALRRDELAWRLEAETVQLRADTRTAAARLSAAHARAVHLRDVALPRQRQVTEATVLQYNAMQVGVFQLLQARRAELDAELELAQAIREAWSARAVVDALGRGVRLDVPLSTAAASSAGATPNGGH